MNTNKILILVLVAYFSLAFSWGGGKPKESKKPAAPKKQSGAVTPSAPAMPAANREGDEEEMKEAVALSEIPKLPDEMAELKRIRSLTQSPIPKIEPINQYNLSKSQIPSGRIPYAAPVPVQIDPAILRIQKQIEEIIKLNESVRVRQQDQIKEIQRIRDQALIHQKILANIKNLEKQKPGLKPTDTDAILRQEKLRLIEEDVHKNRETIKKLKQEEPQATADTPAGGGKPKPQQTAGSVAKT